MLLVIWAVLLVNVLLILVVYTSSFVRQELDVRAPESRILINRLFYSQNGLAYTDQELGKIYPDSIDLNKLNSDLIESTINLENNQLIAGRIQVKDLDYNLIKEDFYNKNWFARWYPLMNKKTLLFFSTLEGEVFGGIIGGFTRYEITILGKKGVPVTLLRHAVYDVRDMRKKCYLKRAVETRKKSPRRSSQPAKITRPMHTGKNPRVLKIAPKKK